MGDAWYGDDPTANRLQELAAERTGMEAALFVPTGTMANQIALALHVHTNGHLVACSAANHVATTEVMTAAALSGIAYRTLDPGPRGWIDAAQARTLLEPDSYYDVEIVDLLSVENTVGGAGGRVMPVDELAKVRAVASEAGVPLHLDGARIFNAAAAAGVEVSAWTRQVDTMMFCVSKGLGAPIGSLICGPAELIREARRLSILFGGAWRQAGIMAAAGIVALEQGRHGSSRTTRELAGSPRASRRCCPARSISRRSKRTWSSSTRQRWGCPCSGPSSVWRTAGWA